MQSVPQDRILTGERVSGVLIRWSTTYDRCRWKLSRSLVYQIKGDFFFFRENVTRFDDTFRYRCRSRWDKKEGKLETYRFEDEMKEMDRFVWRYPCFNLKSKEAYGRPRGGRDVVQPNELTRMRWRERIMFVRRTGLSAPEKLETTTITSLVSESKG